MRIIVFSLLLVLSSFSYGYAKPSAIEQTTQINAKNNPIDELTNAVLENDQGKVKSILDNNRNLINNKNSQGKYPLEMTLILENCEMAELLLNYGADANAKTSSGETIYQLVMKSENKALKKIFAKSKSKN
mgnify:CR=1 FL=1